MNWGATTGEREKRGLYGIYRWVGEKGRLRQSGAGERKIVIEGERGGMRMRQPRIMIAAIMKWIRWWYMVSRKLRFFWKKKLLVKINKIFLQTRTGERILCPRACMFFFSLLCSLSIFSLPNWLLNLSVLCHNFQSVSSHYILLLQTEYKWV